MENEILIYHSEEGRIRLNLKFHNETIWLSQKDIAGIFDCTSDNISLHLKNIYSEGELDENRTTEESSVVQTMPTVQSFQQVDIKKTYHPTTSNKSENKTKNLDPKM